MTKTYGTKTPPSKGKNFTKIGSGRTSSDMDSSGTRPGTQTKRGGKTGQMTKCADGPMHSISVKGGKY